VEITVVSRWSVVKSIAVFVPAWTPTAPFRTTGVVHKDVLITLLGGRIVRSLQGNLVIINSETKETTWPVAATERTNMSFVLFL